jgi:hypothetical protein
VTKSMKLTSTCLLFLSSQWYAQNCEGDAFRIDPRVLICRSVLWSFFSNPTWLRMFHVCFWTVVTAVSERGRLWGVQLLTGMFTSPRCPEKQNFCHRTKARDFTTSGIHTWAVIYKKTILHRYVEMHAPCSTWISRQSFVSVVFIMCKVIISGWEDFRTAFGKAAKNVLRGSWISLFLLYWYSIRCVQPVVDSLFTDMFYLFNIAVFVSCFEKQLSYSLNRHKWSVWLIWISKVCFNRKFIWLRHFTCPLLEECGIQWYIILKFQWTGESLLKFG